MIDILLLVSNNLLTLNIIICQSARSEFWGVASRVPWGLRNSYGKNGNFGRVGDKNMFKMYKKSWGREGGYICIYDCNYCAHSINFFKLTNVMSFSAELFAKGNCYHQNTSCQYPLAVRHVTATVKTWSSVKQ